MIPEFRRIRRWGILAVLLLPTLFVRCECEFMDEGGDPTKHTLHAEFDWMDDCENCKLQHNDLPSAFKLTSTIGKLELDVGEQDVPHQEYMHETSPVQAQTAARDLMEAHRNEWLYADCVDTLSPDGSCWTVYVFGADKFIPQMDGSNGSVRAGIVFYSPDPSVHGETMAMIFGGGINNFIRYWDYECWGIHYPYNDFYWNFDLPTAVKRTMLHELGNAFGLVDNELDPDLPDCEWPPGVEGVMVDNHPVMFKLDEYSQSEADAISAWGQP